MNCIFCKNNSDDSRSVEHILPESLGNNEHYLRKGIVCDSCNNYFSHKIEKVVLDKPYFSNVRHRNFISTKRGRLVPGKAMFLGKQGVFPVKNLWLDNKGFILDSDDQHIVNALKNETIHGVILPVIKEPDKDDQDVSRFLAKIAVEFLAYFIQEEDDWLDEIVNKKELDPIRNYARYGKGPFWKYHQRRIYSEDDRFVNPVKHSAPYEILHEFDIICTEEGGISHFVITIMGIEYVVNFVEPETATYEKWLIDNNYVSPIRRGSEYMIKGNEQEDLDKL